ncbi:MAG: hypothetical protein KAS15_03740 [Nanoarchaeota archaeon]|nr:hypothetical protein [Nanoarchaeota archaeon]MCK5629506.1 hypothetical protein [Nanoarchaeota archaeon]
MTINWIIIIVALVYGFFLARYFFYFHNMLPKQYGLFRKSLISHVVLIAIIILMVIIIKNM